MGMSGQVGSWGRQPVISTTYLYLLVSGKLPGARANRSEPLEASRHTLSKSQVHGYSAFSPSHWLALVVPPRPEGFGLVQPAMAYHQGEWQVVRLMGWIIRSSYTVRRQCGVMCAIFKRLLGTLNMLCNVVRRKMFDVRTRHLVINVYAKGRQIIVV